MTIYNTKDGNLRQINDGEELLMRLKESRSEEEIKKDK